VKKVEFFRKSLDFCGEIWFVEGLSSIEEEEKDGFQSFVRVLDVSKVVSKFRQSNGVNF
jgi:hypothetical protein